MVLNTYTNEKLLLDKAKELKALLESERVNLDKNIVLSHDTQAEVQKWS